MSLNAHHNMRLSFISNLFLTFNNSSNINMFNMKWKCFFCVLVVVMPRMKFARIDRTIANILNC